MHLEVAVNDLMMFYLPLIIPHLRIPVSKYHQTDHFILVCLLLCSCRESWTPSKVRTWTSKMAAQAFEASFPLRTTSSGHHAPHAPPVCPPLSLPLPCAPTPTLKPCWRSRELRWGWKAQPRTCSWTRCLWTPLVALRCHHPPNWTVRRGSPAWMRYHLPKQLSL